jgi:alpha-L-glutamate ligase-like protein
MNARNHGVVQRYNKRQHYPRVDDKLITKRILLDAGIEVPDLLGTVRYQSDIGKTLPRLLERHDRFAIKPAHGSGGRGILIAVGRDDRGRFVKPSGRPIERAEIDRHVTQILSGLYSLGGRPDVAMIEQCIAFTEAFDRFTFQGVPDVRLIVFRGYPVMAMTRLSTEVSDGKANLHQGAVGVGLSLRDGSALKAVQHNRSITHHPDTQADLTELVVPHWEEHMTLATRCHAVTELDYFGADVVIDKRRGPLIIELNARPGLAIQIANGQGLIGRLDAILPLDPEVPVAERIARSRELFC